MSQLREVSRIKMRSICMSLHCVGSVNTFTLCRLGLARNVNSVIGEGMCLRIICGLTATGDFGSLEGPITEGYVVRTVGYVNELHS